MKSEVQSVKILKSIVSIFQNHDQHIKSLVSFLDIDKDIVTISMMFIAICTRVFNPPLLPKVLLDR